MGRRGLYAYYRAPRVESLAFSFNSSGMLNQTGQVDRHTIPPSLTLPSRSSVSGSRFDACPTSSSSSDYGCAVSVFESVPSVSIQEDYINVEVSELIDPLYTYHDEFSTEELSYANDPILDSVSTGLKAEALIKKYG